MKIKIYYHHTDCGGVVYYSNYLNFMEEARTEFLAQRGVLVKDLIQEGILFVVSHQEIDYKLPAFYGDVVEIEARIINISGVRIEFDYEIKNQNSQTIAEAKTILVCVDKNFKPKAIPEEVLKQISK